MHHLLFHPRWSWWRELVIKLMLICGFGPVAIIWLTNTPTNSMELITIATACLFIGAIIATVFAVLSIIDTGR